MSQCAKRIRGQAPPNPRNSEFGGSRCLTPNSFRELVRLAGVNLAELAGLVLYCFENQLNGTIIAVDQMTPRGFEEHVRMIPAHLVLRITLVLCLTLAVTTGLCQQGLAQPGQPVISMDSAQYCIGDSWKFTLSNGVPNTTVSLLGSSNGQSWEIREWGKTDAAGNFSMEGTFAAADAFGSHTLTLDMSGTVSNTISLVVSDCSHTGRIAMNLAEYCAGDPWKFTLSNGVPNTLVHLLGSSNGQPWQIREWGTTDAAGNFSEEGTFNADALGNHTLKLDMGGTASNTLSLVISDCKLTGRIAFASTRDGGAAAGHLAVPYIYVANPDGSSVTRLTRGASPAWSRDGQRIAFHSWIGGSINSGLPEIRVINADGSNERVLGRGMYPSWSPDGTKIAFFYSAIGLQGGIFMMNAYGSGVTRLISNDFANPGSGLCRRNASLVARRGSIAFLLASYEEPWTVHSGPRKLRDPSSTPSPVRG